MSTPEIANMLRAIADVIERNSAAEIADVTRALASASLGLKEKRRGSVKAKANARPNLTSIYDALLQITDRDEARRLLAGFHLTKRELASLARNHNVHVVKEDNVAVLQNKVVEALVGSRLNSRAIRGEP